MPGCKAAEPVGITWDDIKEERVEHVKKVAKCAHCDSIGGEYCLLLTCVKCTKNHGDFIQDAAYVTTRLKAELIDLHDWLRVLPGSEAREHCHTIDKLLYEVSLKMNQY